MNWDAWLLGARTGRALVLLVFILLFWVAWEANEQGSPVSETPVTAVVTEVFDKAYAVKLDNGKQARVFRQGNHQPGDRISVTLSTYANGEQSVTLPSTNHE